MADEAIDLLDAIAIERNQNNDIEIGTVTEKVVAITRVTSGEG